MSAHVSFLVKVLLSGGLFLFPVVIFAADKSGVSPNAISLPNGPGSIEGLGEAFQPSLNSGTGKQSVALRLPPGVPGPVPQVVLRYEGGSGNGILGYGWSLNTRYVQRQTDKGIPQYSESPEQSDTFINEFKEELVPVEQEGRINYFCENEGRFIRYRRVNDHWEGTLPNGTRLVFGETEAARVTRPDDPEKTFRWLLERQVDTHGNTIIYKYSTRPGTQNANQKYRTAIEYGPGPPPWNNFHFVVFEYEGRQDWFEDCRPGFPLRTGSCIRRILIGTQGPELTDHLESDFNHDGIPDFLNRIYQLHYLETSFWSLLDSVKLVGADGSSALPPAKYGYTQCSDAESISAEGKIIESENQPPVLFNNDSVDLIDLNGDALPDLLRTPAGAAHSVYLNQGPLPENPFKIKWSAAVPVNVPEFDPRAWEVELDAEQSNLADMNGDGLADLVEVTAFDTYYYPNEPGPDASLNWGPRNPISIQDFPPPAPYSSPDVRTGDIDFDKRIDIIRSIDVGDSVAYQIWFNWGGKEFSPRKTVTPPNAYSFSEPGVHLTDFNGDRVPDVVKVRPTGLRVIAGLGYGDFSPEQSVAFPDALVLEEEQVAALQLQDLNGDGLADLVLPNVQPGQIWFWINRGNYTLESHRSVIDTPAQTDPDGEFRWADINGNGTTDLIYADSAGLQAIDLGALMGCVPKPHLLNRAENGIGRIQKIDYRTTTDYFLKDGTDDDGNYVYSWPDPLPFPVTVISQVTTLDSLGDEYITRFKFHDGYYAPEEKQFRGFARAEQIEEGDSTAPTLVSHFEFDTGREFKAMKGKVLFSSATREDGQLFWEEHKFWTDPPKTLMTGVNGHEIRYAHPTGGRRTIKEMGQGEEKVIESESDYDDFGNPTFLAEYGIVEGEDRGAFNDERITRTQYAVNLNKWLVRFPRRLEIQDFDGNVISRTEYYYDDESFSGSNFGEVTAGDRTLTRQWIDPSQADSYIDASRVRYDDFGNPVTLVDPLAESGGFDSEFPQGHARKITYDPLFHSYPIQETIHVGDGADNLIFQAEYDAGFGTMTGATDFNGYATSYRYDAFGRMVQTIRPLDTSDYPTAEYDYVLAKPFGEGKMINYVESRLLDTRPEERTGDRREDYFISRQFIDGLGRNVLTKHEGEIDQNSGNQKFVIHGAVLFNARRKPSLLLNPCFSTSGDGLAFEDITAPDWAGIFHEGGEEVTLSLERAHKTQYRYDALLRESRVTHPDGTFKTIIREPLVERRYDENGTDPNSLHYNTPMVYYSDGLGRFVQVDEMVRLNDDGTASENLNTWSTIYKYRSDDALLRITDSQGNEKEMKYDGLGRKTFVNDPDSGVMNFRYDDASNLFQTIDAKGQRISYTYDGVNRLLTEDYHDESSPEFFYQRSPDVSYHYDEPAGEIPMGDGAAGAAANTRGFLAWVEDASGEEHTSYDERGRVQWTVKRIPDPLVDVLVSYKTELEYDSADRLTAVIYPDNDRVTYQYNRRNEVKAIPGGPNGNIISSLTYTPSGQKLRCAYGNGVITEYGYDNRLRLKSLFTAPQANLEDPFWDYSYQLDPASNITRIDDQRPGLNHPAGDPSRNAQIFTYDDLYRLTGVQYSFNLPGEPERDDGWINYRYDRIGNMLSKISGIEHLEDGLSVTNLGEMEYGGDAGAWNRVGRDNPEPGPHALTSASSGRHYPYDANGNMSYIDGLKCTWDLKDRLVAVENDQMRAEYLYDYTDRRIAKVVWRKNSSVLSEEDNPAEVAQPSLTTLYINKFFEVRNHNTPAKFVWDGHTRVARVTGSLSERPRIQRLRMYSGWNLVSLAVTAENALLQLNSRPDVEGESRGVVQSAFQWNPDTLGWRPVSDGETLPAGSVLWLEAGTNAVCQVIGNYPGPPPSFHASSKGIFLGSAGLEPWSWGASSSDSSNFTIWKFDNAGKSWRAQGPTLPIQPPPELPSILVPGETIYIQASNSTDLESGSLVAGIRYYHQNHLGSSSCLSQADGRLIEETTYYPFGHPRYERTSPNLKEHYTFTQKERDRESGLHYFEKRFYAAELARFNRVDPLITHAKPSRLTAPQKLNPYAYALNQPTVRIDPGGAEDQSAQKPTAAELRSMSEEEWRQSFHRWQKSKYYEKGDFQHWLDNSPSFTTPASRTETAQDIEISIKFGNKASVSVNREEITVQGGILEITGETRTGKAIRGKISDPSGTFSLTGGDLGDNAPAVEASAQYSRSVGGIAKAGAEGRARATIDPDRKKATIGWVEAAAQVFGKIGIFEAKKEATTGKHGFEFGLGGSEALRGAKQRTRSYMENIDQ